MFVSFLMRVGDWIFIALLIVWAFFFFFLSPSRVRLFKFQTKYLNGESFVTLARGMETKRIPWTHQGLISGFHVKFCRASKLSK